MKKKIMICDDDESIVEMFELILEDTGADISSEINSLKLYDRLKANKPDVLILDIAMPGISGDQLLKIIRGDEQLNDLPVIMISANLEGERIAKESGATLFYSKPFPIDEFLTSVNKLVA